METIVRDLRMAARSLARTPLLTALAALSFGLGVGANTTVYTWVKALLLEPHPLVHDAGRLVSVQPVDPRIGGTSVSWPDFKDLSARSTSFTGLVATRSIAVAVGVRDQPLRVHGELVSANYFDVLGVPLAHGRGFLPSEGEAPLRDPVIILGYDTWVRHFGADPALVGRTVTVNARPLTVVGIAGEGFYGTKTGLAMQAWIPMMLQEWVDPGGAGRLDERGDNWLAVIARLAPGVSLDRAANETVAIFAAIDRDHPQNAVVGGSARLSPLWRSQDSAGALLGPVFAVLGALAVLVLAIASSNVACLLIARSLSRQREMAVRSAMGATRGRLLGQLITESLLLAFLGGASGLVVAWAGAGLLQSLVPATDYPVRLGARVDYGALGVAFLLSAIFGLAFGLLPALHGSRTETAVALREAGASVAGGRKTGRWFGRLVIAQIAGATVLLVAAGLFLRSADNAVSFPKGLDPKGVALTSMDLFSAGYDRDRGQQFFERLATEAAGLPGVRSVGLARRVPLGFGGTSSTSLEVPGHVAAGGESPYGLFNVVSPGYFRTVRTPVLKGREFEAGDRAGSRPVGVINETMARLYYAGREPLGASFLLGGDAVEIVGVVQDSRFRDLSEAPAPWFYLPLAQRYRPDMTLFVRGDGDPVELAAPVRALVRQIDPVIAVVGQRSFAEHVTAATLRQKLGARMLGLLGTLGLALAAVGLFGTLAYRVAQRSRELSVRLALGCSPAEIVGLVAGDTRRLLLPGLAAGCLLALAAGVAMKSLLIGVSPWDPLVFGSVVVILSLTAFVAGLLPARRAAATDPLLSLRAD